LEPFTEFQVTEVKKVKENNANFQIYMLQQIMTSKKLPVVKANFIVWVDNYKPEEGKKIFESVKMPGETSLLVQLGTTQ
jgi:hypothetical protein